MNIKIIEARKKDEDGQLITNWRNDQLTRKNSLNPQKKEWDTFKTEYYNNYFKNIPLFASFDGIKFAFVSFCQYTIHNNNTYSIGINICPEYRGKGLSKHIIYAALNYIKKYNHIKTIVAEIKSFNIPSIKTFTRCGFKYVSSTTVGNYELGKYVYIIN